MDADEIVKAYGADALNWGGEVIDTVDGLTILSDVVELIEAVKIVDDKRAAKAAHMDPLIALYQDPGRWSCVVESSVKRDAEVESLILRVERASTGALAKSLRSKLKAGKVERSEKLQSSLRALGAGEELPDIKALVDWPEYPAGLTVPHTHRDGWQITATMLTKVRNTEADSIRTPIGPPILMTCRRKDVDTGEFSVELAWKEGENWVKENIPRKAALDTRSLISLCDRGIPVDSTTAKDIVTWLGLLDRQEAMPLELSTVRMGWVGSGTKTFLLGEKLISKTGRKVRDVSLVTDSAGSRQTAKSITTKGTWEGWLEALALIGPYPSPWLAIYAAACAALLKILGAPNFGLDFAGPSSSGKTTVLEMAVSTYAIPRKGTGYGGWGGTLAGTEGAAGFGSDLPLPLDEGQLIAPARRIEAGILLQTLIDGSGRTKGSLGRLGQSQIESWQTVLISTSETGIRSWSTHEGVKARVLEIQGRPLGTGEALRAEAISRQVHQHYGHLMPRWIQLLTDADAEMRAELVRWWEERIEELTTDDDLPAFARRAARYMAALDLAASLLHGHLGLPEPEVAVAGWAWAKVVKSYTGTDTATSALETAWAWIWANEAGFEGSKAALKEASESRNYRIPSGGWLGRWDTEIAKRVGVVPDVLSTVLRKAGYSDPEHIYRAWIESGAAVGDKGGRTRLKMRLGNGRAGLIVLILEER